jgi:hypothetical protein
VRDRQREPATHTAAFRILKFLALSEEGPRTAYEIENAIKVRPENGAEARIKRPKLHTPTVDAALFLLETTGLVNVTERLASRAYEINGQGIVALLQGHPDLVELSKDDVKELARIQEWFLPLIFRKWSGFREKGVEDIAYVLLLGAARTLGTTATISVGGPTEPGRTWEPPRTGFYSMGYDFRHDLVMSGFITHMLLKTGSSVPTDTGRLPPLGKRDECVLRHDIYGGMLLLGWFYSHSLRSVRKDTAKTYGDWLDVVLSDDELMTAAQRESERLAGELEEYTRFWRICLNHIRDRKLPMAYAYGYFTRAFDGHEQIPARLHYYWRLSRAHALEEGRPLPSLDNALEELDRSETRAQDQ